MTTDGRLPPVNSSPTIPPGADGTLLTVSELAAFLAVQEQTLRAWCARKEIPHGRIGREIRFDRDQVQDWLDRRWSAGTDPVS